MIGIELNLMSTRIDLRHKYREILGNSGVISHGN